MDTTGDAGGVDSARGAGAVGDLHVDADCLDEADVGGVGTGDRRQQYNRDYVCKEGQGEPRQSAAGVHEGEQDPDGALGERESGEVADVGRVTGKKDPPRSGEDVMAADRDALLLELFDANKVVDAGYRPTVGGGYPDSAQGLVSKDSLVYVPGGYTTVGDLEAMDTVGGFSMVGGARSQRRRTRKGRGRKGRGRGQNRSSK